MDNNNNFNQNFENQAPLEPAIPQNYVPQPETPQNYVPQPETPQNYVPQPVQTEPIYNGVPQGDIPPVPAQEVKSETNGMAIGSLVTGILSITCCCGNPIGIILSIIAIVLGAVSKKQPKENNTMAIVGIILGAVGIVFAIVGTIIIISAGLFAGVAESSYSYYY